MKICATVAALVLLLATFAHAADSQFLFDANGNLLVQAAEISAPPQITRHPQTRVVGPGETASFLVVARGPQPLSYQWRFNNTDVAATTEALLLLNVGTNSEGQYSVVVANSSGSVTSAPALLIIDSDGDAMGDSWETTFFGSLDQDATSDFDGDDSSNLDEFRNGTDPTDRNSFARRLVVISDLGSVIKTPNQAIYTNGQTVTLTAIPLTNGLFYAWLGDVVTRSNPVTVVMTRDKTVYARFTPSVFTWTSPFSGDWETDGNWTPNLAPNSNDTAVIVRTVTVTLNTAVDCRDFTLGSVATGPTLTGNGTLKVRGAFVWASGTMSGSGRTIVEPGASLSIENPIATGVSLSGRALENGGTVLWTGAGNIVLGTAVITNRVGALFHVQNAATFVFSGGSPRFDNAGTFRKSDNAGTLMVENGISFNNSGAVEIQTGTLRLGGGGSATGTFEAPASTSVEWTSGTYTLNAGAQLNGAGLYRSSTTVIANTNIAVQNLDLIGGTLSGTGTVTISNAMTWTGGIMSGSGRTIISPGATLNAAIPSAVSLVSRTLENGGTVLRTGAGSVDLINGAVITNRTGALFEVRSAAPFVSIFAPNRIDNAGIFRKSVNAGTTTIPNGVSFNNSGTLDIRTGILAANGGYISSPNALLNCALGGTTPGTGYGQLQVAGAVTLNGALSIDLINGFLPTTNDLFTVLTAGTRNGTFANFFYPSNVATMQLSNTANSVIVRVTGIVVPEVVLFPPVLSSSNVLVCWTAQSNKTYRLEFNLDSSLTNWDAVPGDVTTISNKACKLDALTSSNRFYRVRVLP